VLSYHKAEILTVASHYQELIVIRDVMHSNIWIRRDDLLLRGKVGALLEFEIANSS
jgi:hypothetical protein